jgi:hypothetical protein
MNSAPNPISKMPRDFKTVTIRSDAAKQLLDYLKAEHGRGNLELSQSEAVNQLIYELDPAIDFGSILEALRSSAQVASRKIVKKSVMATALTELFEHLYWIRAFLEEVAKRIVEAEIQRNILTASSMQARISRWLQPIFQGIFPEDFRSIRRATELNKSTLEVKAREMGFGYTVTNLREGLAYESLELRKSIELLDEIFPDVPETKALLRTLRPSLKELNESIGKISSFLESHRSTPSFTSENRIARQGKGKRKKPQQTSS